MTPLIVPCKENSTHPAPNFIMYNPIPTNAIMLYYHKPQIVPMENPLWSLNLFVAPKPSTQACRRAPRDGSAGLHPSCAPRGRSAARDLPMRPSTRR
jgi:hypothetical protein